MSLYRERAGALHVVCFDEAEAARVRGHLKQIARARYSNPPAFGARLAARVLDDESLRRQWLGELVAIRTRIRTVRQRLEEQLAEKGVKDGIRSLTRQQGMFSYTGLSESEMNRLRSQFGIYGVDSGRICVAAINSFNMASVASALSAVIMAR